MSIIKEIENILKQAQIEEYRPEARLIVLGLSNLSLDEILLDENKISNRDEMIELAHKRAQTRAPIQHLLGFCEFMDERYIVNENVLIPRDETQILVESAYELVKNKENKIDILDIGVGSGCISCALAKKFQNREIEILGVDISSLALIVAIENINKLDLIRKVIVRKSDIFSKIRDCEKFDLIVSNPPYIPISKKDELQNEVKDWEPAQALFAQDIKGIEFYEKIIKDAPKYLKKDGFLIFELGINQSEEVFALLEKDFKDIQIKKDLAGIDRVIWAKYYKHGA